MSRWIVKYQKVRILYNLVFYIAWCKSKQNLHFSLLSQLLCDTATLWRWKIRVLKKGRILYDSIVFHVHDVSLKTSQHCQMIVIQKCYKCYWNVSIEIRNEFIPVVPKATRLSCQQSYSIVEVGVVEMSR